jgi:GH24 family phage-related lysozyme (muramidase)
MADRQSLVRRWEDYRPSKATWVWSCAACVAATLVIGFTWAGWVTGGTSTRMAADAADGARAQMAAADCVNRFEGGPAAIAQLAELKKAASSYSRSDLLQKAGWVTMPGSKDPVAGAAVICAQALLNPAPPTTKG